MSNPFVKSNQYSFASLCLGRLAISLSIIALVAMPAYSQGNTDLEVFAGGLTKTNPQGFPVDQGNALRPGAGAIIIKRNALEPVTWYKSRRQISIEDDSPIVTNRSGYAQGAGGLCGQGMLTPATFGGCGAMASAMAAPRNLTPAQFGPRTKTQLAQARPLMHSLPGGLQSKPTGTNSPIIQPIANAPARVQPPPTAASYSGYRNVQAVSASADSEAARVREVKARLLGNR